MSVCKLPSPKAVRGRSHVCLGMQSSSRRNLPVAVAQEQRMLLSMTLLLLPLLPLSRPPLDSHSYLHLSRASLASSCLWVQFMQQWAPYVLQLRYRERKSHLVLWLLRAEVIWEAPWSLMHSALRLAYWQHRAHFGRGGQYLLRGVVRITSCPQVLFLLLQFQPILASCFSLPSCEPGSWLCLCSQLFPLLWRLFFAWCLCSFCPLATVIHSTGYYLQGWLWLKGLIALLPPPGPRLCIEFIHSASNS